MEFGLSSEQRMIVDTVRDYVETELYPLEQQVEIDGGLDPDVGEEVRQKVIDMGFYAASIPEEFGGGGLDSLSFTLLERELGRTSMALNHHFGRPSNILCACNDEQKERYLYPSVRGEKYDCLAMTEPDAGSDVRSMTTAARKDGDDYILNGTKHFISHADISDFAIVFATTGVDETPRGQRSRISTFLVDRGTPGFEIRDRRIRLFDPGGSLENRPGIGGRPPLLSGEALCQRNAGPGDRPRHTDLRRNGSDGRVPHRTVLARCPGRKDLGRDQRNPAPYHIPQPASSVGGLG